MKGWIVAVVLAVSGVSAVAQEAPAPELAAALKQRQDADFQAAVLKRLDALEQRKTDKEQRTEAKRRRQAVDAFCAAQGQKRGTVEYDAQTGKPIRIQCR